MAKVSLSFPTEIENDWEHCWFDPSHQHFLLLNDSYFYLLSCELVNQAPTLFAHVRDLPRGLLCGRVSMDKKLIAIQTSQVAIVVINVSSKKRYTIDIRYPHENAILPSGVMWSDHGGNSEDLIIITSRGMELYKVSQLRDQCKISRVISQPITSYWFNSEHRMIMLAAHAQPKLGYNRHPQSAFFTPEERPKEMLLVDGFFLNCEKSSMPMLELPPPDRVPRLELGPGLGTEDLSLVSLYGKILCLARYVEHGMDYITVFHITKAKAERIHCLSLNGATHGLQYSTYDNLLICHCMGERVSVIFDILSSPARSKEGVSSSDKTFPLGTASPMHFLHKHKGSSAAVNAVSSARYSATAGDRSVSHDGRRSSANLHRGSLSNQSDGDARSKSRDAADTREWGPLVTPQRRHSRMGQQMMFARKEADISNFDSLTFVGELTDSAADSAGDNAQYVVLANPEPALEAYSSYAFEQLGCHRLLDSHRRIVWDIKCSYAGIVRDMTLTGSDPKEIPLFLSRRGQRYTRLKQAAEGVLEYGVVSMEGRLAKQLMLSELFNMLLRRADATSLKAYYRGLMRSYGCEHRRLILAQYEAMHNAEAGQQISPVAPPSPSATSAGSTSFFSMTAAARRRVVAESLFGTTARRQASTAPPSHVGNMGVYPGLLSLLPGSTSPVPPSSTASEAADTASVLDYEPLEQSGTMQVMLPDISMVGVRARKQHYYAVQQSVQSQPASTYSTGPNSPASVNSALGATAPKIKPTCQAVALHTRRDLFGCLFCSQAEILSHVWLPILLNSQVDHEYCALALTLFVMHLRESCVSVAPVFSAVLLNVLFHSHRYVEVSRLLQERQLPDSLDLALYSLEFCDMLQDHIDNVSGGERSVGASGGGGSAEKALSRSPSGSSLVSHAAAEGSVVAMVDAVVRHRSALANMRQAALDVLRRLDERTFIVKWHLSHGHILEAIAVCRRRNGQWQAPLTPGSIPASEFFLSAVAAANSIMKPIDAEVLQQSEKSAAEVSAKEVRRLQDQLDAAAAAVVQIFHALYLFLKEWDGVVLLSATVRAKRCDRCRRCSANCYLLCVFDCLEYRQISTGRPGCLSGPPVRGQNPGAIPQAVRILVTSRWQ
jgi:hypothetical protein